MRLKRVFAALMVAGILLAAPLLFGILRSSAATANDSLLAYFKFEESLVSDNKVDYSGDSHPGSPSGTVLPPYSGNTPPTNYGNGKSLTFGNTNNAVNITSTAALDDLANMSASAWIYPTSYSGESAQGRIVDKTNSVNGWSFYVDNGALHFYSNFSSSALNKVTTATLPTNTWAHVAVSWDGTANSSGVKLYINGVEQSSFSVDTSGVGSRIADTSYNIILGNNSALNRTFAGEMDEVRIYNRMFLNDEVTDMADGDHPTATWTGATSTDYETATNWDTGAIPDPYAHVRISPAANVPMTSTNIALGELTIDSGARLNVLGHNVQMNDGGAFNNDGTLQLRNSQTFTGFTNDTDSGTVLLTPVGDTTGLKTGNGYHDLILNDSTFAHWPLDEAVGTVASDISGFERNATYVDEPEPSTDVPSSNYTNPNSLEFDGVDDALSISNQAIPENATWCAWANISAGDAVILGADTPGQYALAVFGGTEVRAYEQAGGQQASWTVPSVYGSWKHYCITQTDLGVTHGLTLYIDGASQGGSETLLDGAGIINRIGTDSVTYLGGLVDDVRIYSRVLTGAEINAMVAGDMPGTTLYRTALGAAVDVNGDFLINSGIFDTTTSNYNVTIGGDFDNNGGVFTGRNSTVTLDGDNQQIKSSTTFYNLTKQVAAAATLTFGTGSMTEVSNQLTLNGTAGELLSLRSSVDGEQWYINPSGSETIEYLDVMDSHNIDPYPVDLTNKNTIDSGNNTNWTINVAPAAPTNLGAAGYIGGGFVGDNTPTLGFDLTDTNPADLLRFQIQIDNTSDFSSPEVDYVSPATSQGTRNFTVGQGEIDDTYNVGSDGMSLATGNYYWRVKTIDNYVSPNESAYTVANSGSIAFQLDVTAPSDPGLPSTVSTQTNKIPTWTWTASADSESGLGSPTYTLQWSKDNTFNTGVSSNTTNNTTFTHGSNLTDGYWYFRVRAADAMGNNSSWSTSVSHLIDTTGPATPGAPYTSSPTNFNQPTWSWSAPVDAGAGLAATPYTVQWSQISNFSGGVSSSTSSTNNFPHPSVLTDGTWYFRLKAADALGNESAWSSASSVLIDTTPPSLAGQPYTADNPTNDNTPTWNWDPSIDAGVGLTATPYSVQWSNMGDFTNIGGSTSSSTNSFTHGGALADGTWYIRINARDTLLNQSAYSTTGTVTIDTVAPDTPATPTTTSPTNDDTPTWTWAVPDDEGVGLSETPYEIEWSQDSDFSSIESSAEVDVNSFTHTDSLAEGTWYFRVRATDEADNTSEFSAGGEVEIDVTAPTVPGDPTTGDPVSEATPTWTWTASSDSGVGLATTMYELSWSTDNTFTTGVETDTSDTNAFTHTDSLEDGTWYFRVRAVDAVTNASAWSNAGSKVVDNNPPTVPGTPTTTTPTADNTPEWTWTASTDAGQGLDANPYMIEWSKDNTFNVNVESDSIASNSFTHTDTLTDGMWYFRVRAADAVGNISGFSTTGQVFVDTTAPSTPGQASTTSPTADSTPAWTWAASSDGVGIGLATNAYTIEWSADNTFSDDVISSTTTTNSFTHTDSLEDGTWYFRVRAVDAVGNTSADATQSSVVVDDTAPSVPGAPSTPTPTNDDTPTWSWSASTDNGVGLRTPTYDVQWSTDNTFLSGVQSSQTHVTSFTHSGDLADGTWYFRVRAVDTLSNTSSYSTPGSVLISTAGPSIPGEPSPGESPTTDTTPSWTWTASTADAGLADPAYHLEWSQDSSFLSTVITDTVNTNSFTHTDTLADGTWYFRIRAEDNTDIFSLYSSHGSVLVDTTAPSVPASITTPTPTNDRTPTWTWDTSTDSGVGLDDPAYYLEWSQDSDFSGGVSSSTVNDTTFTHASDLTDGTWYFRIRAEDVLANQSAFSSVVNVVIDASAPTTPSEPSTTSPTSDTTPTWTWDTSTDSGVGLDNPAYEIQWSQSSGFSSGISNSTTNNTNFTHVSTLTDGTWYFRVRATDDVGNQTSWSANGDVVIDSAAPTVPGSPSAGVSATNDVTPTWTWAASTDSGVGLGSPAYEVQWSEDEDFLGGISSNTTASATFTHGSDLPEGTWYFRIRAVDGVGNQSGWSGNGSVYIDTDAPSAPGTPNTTVSPTNNRTPTWTWDASNDSGFGFGDTPYQLQWSQDSSFVTDVQSSSHDADSFTHSSDLTDGTWYFRVRAEDDAGNASSWSSHGTIVIDATAPTAPANLSTDTPTKDSTPTWTWDASTDSGVGLGSPTYEIEWSASNDFSNAITETTDDPTFTHTDMLDFGVWYFRVRAFDQINNSTAWVSGEISIDNTPPVLSSITATPGSAGALITWTTNEIASSRVIYSGGLGFTETTEEVNTDPRVTSHSVLLQNLPACSTIQFQVASIDQLDNEAISGSGTFTTTACSGNAAIITQNNASIGVDGGQVNLQSGLAAAKIQIPGGAVSADTDFQIKQLSPASALSGIGQPSGYSLVGSHLYDFKALAADTTVIKNFDGSLTVTMTYSDAEAAGFTPSSFAIFRHDGTSWQQLGGCQVITASKQVSCQTTAFSVFGLFGVRTVPAPPLPVGDGVVEPDPIPETKPIPEKTTEQEQEGFTGAANNRTGIAGAVSRFFGRIISRPVWWVSLLLLFISAGMLFYLKKIRKPHTEHSHFGIHKDE